MEWLISLMGTGPSGLAATAFGGVVLGGVVLGGVVELGTLDIIQLRENADGKYFGQRG